MKGDKIVVQDHHRRAASQIMPRLGEIRGKQVRHVIAVAGGSGSGKSETERALADALQHRTDRARGKEAGGPLVEQVPVTEHLVTAGHRQLADYVITKDYHIVVGE
jgi:hypothetical protein